MFESLREMKAMIEREVERRDLAGNIKLGPGGIREIEFLAQSLQLIRGGREPWLRTPSLLKVLPLLDRSRLLPPGAAAELRAAYEFLRLIENRLQERADEQTHTLPKTPPLQAGLAQAMALADWPALRAHARCASRSGQPALSRRGVWRGGAAPRRRGVAIDLESPGLAPDDGSAGRRPRADRLDGRAAAGGAAAGAAARRRIRAAPGCGGPPAAAGAAAADADAHRPGGRS